jgi:hypothetical protein
VFDGKKWTESKVFTDPAHGVGVFEEDDQKRLWYHLHKTAGLGQGDDGVWAFDGKTWAAHTPDGRAKGEYIDSFLPFADDWFLVVVRTDRPNQQGYPRWFAWSPGRTADAITKAKKFDDLPQGMEYRGTDRDGVRYFVGQHRGIGGGDTPKPVTVTATGTVKEIADDHPIFRQPHKFYRSNRPIHATAKDPTPAVPFDVGDAIGRDADGRVYFAAHNGVRGTPFIWVYWPKQEKPGECVRPTAYPEFGEGPRARPAVYADLFADATGIGFARPRDQLDAVLAWDAKAEKWAETPIKPLPQAHWYARPAPPPEYGWANLRAVGHVCGTDGLDLFLRVKTKYAPEKEAEGRPGLGSGLPKVDADAPFYIYEAWLHAGGKWSESLPPADLIKAKRKELTAAFAVPATPLGPVPVIAHADRLWFAHDWKVFGIDADGVMKAADIPQPKVDKLNGREEKDAPPLMRAAFAKLDGKTLVLVVSGKSYAVRFQPGKLGGVKVEELGPLPLASPTLHVAPDGTVLAWGANPAAVHHLKGEKWEGVPDVGRVVAVGGDGSVWCDPSDRVNDADLKKGSTVLYRVGGAKAERFVWTPDEVTVGFDQPADGAAMFTPVDKGLMCVEPGKPGAKPALRVRWTPPLASYGHPGLPVVSGSGHLLLAAESAKLFDPKGK